MKERELDHRHQSFSNRRGDLRSRPDVLRKKDRLKSASKQQSSTGQTKEKKQWARESEQQRQILMGGDLSEFFKSLGDKVMKWSVNTLAPAILSVALLPIVGPAVATVTAVGVAAVVKSIQDKLEPLGLHLQTGTINKLVEPLQGKQVVNENELRKVIWKVLPDGQTNDDLKQFFQELQPTIERAANSTTINISGDVHGLITGDKNTITQTFSGFLPDKD